MDRSEWQRRYQRGLREFDRRTGRHERRRQREYEDEHPAWPGMAAALRDPYWLGVLGTAVIMVVAAIIMVLR